MTQVNVYIINVLRNELIAETANVSITDTDGILITNGADTKALSLKGGIFAIANSKTGNSWNWRTFGTGDGFTADCIVTGKLLTSLVEIVGEAIEGENKFYWDTTGLYAVDPNNANRYMVLNKEGLRGTSMVFYVCTWGHMLLISSDCCCGHPMG